MVWVWTIAYEKNIAIIMNKSRGAYVMDAYMDKFDVAVTDGYPVYARFDPGGMHQRCWVHKLRAVNHMTVHIIDSTRICAYCSTMLKIISTAVQVYDMRLSTHLMSC